MLLRFLRIEYSYGNELDFYFILILFYYYYNINVVLFEIISNAYYFIITTQPSLSL
jgi:hypothetical protein